MTSKLCRLGAGLCLLILCFGLAGQPSWASNDAYGEGTYGSCTYQSCPLTITTSGTVNVNVIPTPSSRCTIQNDAVGVTTDASTGYTLTVKDSDTNNHLSGTAGSIAAVSGSQASPVTLSANTWGYRVDGVGGFGSGPTSAATNAAPSSLTFAPLPLSSGTADTLATTSSAADPTVTTNVWYGVCANDTIAAGTYSDSAVYTAVIN